MPIVNADIDYFHSAGGPALSIGGAISATEVTDATLHNMFDIVSSTESTDGHTDYRCEYVKNSHGTLTLQSAVVWIQTITPSTDTVCAIGLGSSGVNGIEQTIADELTPPVGVTFTSPTTEGAGLSIGDIPAGQHMAIWIRRIISSNAGAYNADGVVLRAKGDTAA